MSLDKAIEHGKEKRKPYRGAAVFVQSCRNHGGCPWCEEDRKHKFRDKKPITKEDLDFLGDVSKVVSLNEMKKAVLKK
jgi:hypothetical protein